MTEPVMVGGAPVPASNKRAFTMLGVAAVVAVLILVLPKLLFAGGDEEAVDEAEVPASVLPPSGALEGALPGGGGAEQALADPARTFEVFSTKNPFTPLIDMTPVAIPVPGASAIVVPTTGAPAPVLGAPAPAPVSGEPAPAPAPVFGAPAPAPVFGAPAPAPVPGAPAPAPAFGAPTPAAEPRSGQRVALLEVFVDAEGVTVASIRVNDTVYEVAEGASFATSYEVVTLSVADGCGQLLYGDDRFRLCEGEELLK